jgi:hypothetical protein
MNVRFISSKELDGLSTLSIGNGAEVLVVMPYVDRDKAERCAVLMARRADVDGLILGVCDVDCAGFVAVANRVFRLSNSKYFGYVAQDAFPGRSWLAVALRALRTQDKGLFAFNDGKWMGALASFGIASREWALKNYKGDFFFPGYRSHYADVELSVLAMSERTYCYDANSVLIELDWDKDRKWVNEADRYLYGKRKTEAFEGRVAEAALLGMFA